MGKINRCTCWFNIYKLRSENKQFAMIFLKSSATGTTPLIAESPPNSMFGSMFAEHWLPHETSSLLNLHYFFPVFFPTWLVPSAFGWALLSLQWYLEEHFKEKKLVSQCWSLLPVSHFLKVKRGAKSNLWFFAVSPCQSPSAVKKKMFTISFLSREIDYACSFLLVKWPVFLTSSTLALLESETFWKFVCFA